MPSRTSMAFITDRNARLDKLASSFGTLSGTRTRPASGITYPYSEKPPSRCGKLFMDSYMYMRLLHAAVLAQRRLLGDRAVEAGAARRVRPGDAIARPERLTDGVAIRAG